MQDIVKINKNDDIAVALRPISMGEIICMEGTGVTVTEDIPQGHKLALGDIRSEEGVIKYGLRIRYVGEDIEVDSRVHVHSVETALGNVPTYDYISDRRGVKSTNHVFFGGYHRADGKIGIRNEIWVIPTVGHVDSVAEMLEARAGKLTGGTVEDVIVFPHPYGYSQMGDDQENTREVLTDMTHHPNVGGVLVSGLRYESSSIPVLMDYIGEYNRGRVKSLQRQDVKDEIEATMGMLEELAAYVDASSRGKVDVDELVVGMKCGGSGGLSGVTANPVAGAFSDLLVNKSGTTIPTGVPETSGAETILVNRCAILELFSKTANPINGFKNYSTSHNQTTCENPLLGNKKRNISALEDKSLSCTQKSGSAFVRGVLEYGGPVRVKGLDLLSALGNDLVAFAALAVSGAHVVLFTTGRGAPFASPVPTVKISSNPRLTGHKDNWVDLSVGRVMEDMTKEGLAQELLDCILAVTSGEEVKSEGTGFHDMTIFEQGVILQGIV